MLGADNWDPGVCYVYDIYRFNYDFSVQPPPPKKTKPPSLIAFVECLMSTMTWTSDTLHKNDQLAIYNRKRMPEWHHVCVTSKPEFLSIHQF